MCCVTVTLWRPAPGKWQPARGRGGGVILYRSPIIFPCVPCAALRCHHSIAHSFIVTARVLFTAWVPCTLYLVPFVSKALSVSVYLCVGILQDLIPVMVDANSSPQILEHLSKQLQHTCFDTKYVYIVLCPFMCFVLSGAPKAVSVSRTQPTTLTTSRHAQQQQQHNPFF